MDGLDRIERVHLGKRSWRNDDVSGIGIEVVHQSVVGDGRAVVIPAQAVIQSEALRDLKGVGDEQTRLVLVIETIYQRGKARAVEWNAEQEIAIAQAGIRSV